MLSLYFPRVFGYAKYRMASNRTILFVCIILAIAFLLAFFAIARDTKKAIYLRSGRLAEKDLVSCRIISV